MAILNALRHRTFLAGTALAATALLASCGSSGSTGAKASAGSGTGVINVWSLGGTPEELTALRDAVKSYNSSQSTITAKLRELPGDNYTTTEMHTPVDQLPDVLQMDGPLMASFAYNGKITPITDYVSKAVVDNATPGSIAEGTYNGKLYALAQFDSAMGLWGNKSMLDAAGVKYPTSIQNAWTPEEFTAAVKKLAAASPTHKSIDIGENGLSTEWGTYGFAPLVWSAGGNILARNKATGVLDSDADVKALTTLASWKPYSDANADGKAFIDKRVALSIGGHWNYPTNSKALGKDLITLPLPNFGKGSKSGAGSLTWGIGAGTKNGKAAGSFLDYLLNDTNVKAMTQATGAPAATKTVFGADTRFASSGPLALWGEQLSKACAADAITDNCIAIFRPVTPGYPTVTASFASALGAIWGGADPKSELTKAAQKIDSNFADNDNYQR
jgi:multiple sugar transport system substrate-binding protein